MQYEEYNANFKLRIYKLAPLSSMQCILRKILPEEIDIYESFQIISAFIAFHFDRIAETK